MTEPVGITQKEMIKSMYKILVTGNGEPPLPEVVRNHTAQIAAIIECAEKKKEKGWSVVLIALKEVAVIIGLAVAISLGLK